MRFGGWDRVASFGCGMQLMMLPWEYEPPVPGMYVTLCTYEPALGSWASCVDQVVREHVKSDKEYNSVFATSVDFANLVCTKAGGGLAQFTVEEYAAALKNASSYIQDTWEGPLHTPVKLDERARIRTIDAVHAEFLNLDNSNDSVLWVYYYFFVVLAVLLALQCQTIRQRLLQVPSLNVLRARFELPTIWGSSKHAVPSLWGLGGLLPSSFEGVLLLFFFIVHTYALFDNYSVDYREVLETTFLQRLQALGNRSGILAFGLMPLVIIFSMRGNILIRFTGLRYTTFLVLHRWLGRMIVIDSLIHSVAFYYHEKLVGALSGAATQWWWTTGIIALVVSCVILVLATGALRSRWYEIFLYTHIALAILFFYFSWIHVKTFGWLNWIIWSCAFWVGEHLYRLYLVFLNGGVIAADITLVSNDLLSISFAKPKRWTSHSTQYAFVYFLLPAVFWQSHPFTVNDNGNQLEIVVSVKSGVTKVLQASAQNRMKIPIALEGPYGVTQSLHNFDKILLIGGGSGVPGPLALAREYPNSHLIIVTRNLDLIEAYRIQDIPSDELNMDIYYTAKEPIPDSLALRKGRPDFAALISELTEYHSAAVVCCGPPQLNDCVRNLTASVLRQNPGLILEYLEEYQIW